MAGLEPASERFVPRTSTSVGYLYFLRQGREIARPARRQPLRPESLLSYGTRRPVRHSDFVTPGSTTGQRAGWADVALREGDCATPRAYAARGIAA